MYQRATLGIRSTVNHLKGSTTCAVQYSWPVRAITRDLVSSSNLKVQCQCLLRTVAISGNGSLSQLSNQKELSADAEVAMTESALFTDGFLPFQQR